MVANAAVPAAALRERFVQISQRVGLLLSRYARSLTWTDVAGKCEELTQEMEQERWAIIKEVASLQREELHELLHQRLTAYLNDLATAAARADAYVKTQKKREVA